MQSGKMSVGVDGGTILLVGGIAAGLYFGVFDPLLKALGVKDSKDSKKAKELGKTNAFDPNYWKQGGVGTKLITVSGATAYAKVIYDAHGFFNDDEDKVRGVFRQLRTKSQVSFLADYFYRTFNKGLFDYLQTFLGPSDLSAISDIVERLPNFKVS
jgi:hypothetical protein